MFLRLSKANVNYALRNKMHSILKGKKIVLPAGWGAGGGWLCCNRFRMRAEQRESKDDEMLVGGCRHGAEV